MIYCIYHIPGKKVGVTNNVEDRVERQQGYEPHEYEIIEMSDDISYISDREVFWQKAFGYKVDRQLYKNLFTNNKTKLNTMKINVTEATTTFPCPLNKLKGQLMDQMGMRWETSHGNFTITHPTVNWIMANAKVSMYNNDRCYIYNKAMSKFYDKDPHRNITIGKTHQADLERINTKHFSNQDEMVDYYSKKSIECNQCEESLFDCIRKWADERGLYDKGDPKTQYIKLMEEAGEVGRALLKDDIDEVVDGIGDMVVVLTNLAELCGVSIEECIQEAYDIISKRTGKMKNGTFVKDTL
jgi:NTP pyrophosphatase (non-canonical NTP hydrolase)